MANPDLITITATIYQDNWHYYSGYLEDGQQAIVELTLTDPYDYEPYGIDPDVYVYSPDWSSIAGRSMAFPSGSATGKRTAGSPMMT